MSAGIAVGRQLGDLAAYLLLPALCLLLPTGWGERLIRRVARQGWLLEARSAQACDAAQTWAGPLATPAAWRQRWRLVELSDARDCWFCVFGRTGRLLENIDILGEWPQARPGLALVGLHWGTGILALQLFRKHGLEPRFVYRGVDRRNMSSFPFLSLYQAMTIRAINRICAGRAISTPGAAAALDDALQGDGTPVVLLDAPPEASRRVAQMRLLESNARLAVGGMELLVSHGAQCILFDLGLQSEGEGRRLRIQAPSPAEDLLAVQQLVGRHFNDVVGTDSAQWRLWHAADQLFERAENRTIGPE